LKAKKRYEKEKKESVPEPHDTLLVVFADI
jgi:hypothetical protein